MPCKDVTRAGVGDHYTCGLPRKSFVIVPFMRSLALAATAWLAMAAGAAAQTAPIFVLNSLDANVSIIDPATWKEVRRLPTGKEPHHLYLTPDEKSLIVANSLSDSLTFIDP